MKKRKLQIEINKTNVLIAKFMDCSIDKKRGLVKRTTKYWDFPEGSMYCYIEDLRYNTSWDWLIPIVKKVIPPHGFKLNDIKYQTAVLNSLHTLDIDKIYNAVIEFIKHSNDD